MRKWLIGAGLGALLAVPALAQQGEGGPPPMRGPTTRAQAQAAASDQFARLDTNHDGVITRDEFDAARAAMHARAGGPPPDGPPPGGPDGSNDAPPPPPGHGSGMGMGMGMGGMGGHWFDRVDTDHDGRVTLAETQAAAMTLFDMVDSNHDGTISPDERHAAMEMMRAMHPGHGG